MNKHFLSLVLLLVCLAPNIGASNPIDPKSLDRLSREVGLGGSLGNLGLKPVKIAILDNGFKGADASLGTLRSGPIAVDPAHEEEHGAKMAEIVQGLLLRSGVPTDVHLFSAFGYSNFEAAVNAVINEKFDIVLYSQVWEYGGNGDGRGFINSLVDRALDRGTLWVNAAGNFNNGTFRSPISKSTDDWVKLPGANDSAVIRCQPLGAAARKTCKARIVLSWNSFADDVKIGTDKDLDLVLTDDTLRILKTGGLQQKPAVAATDSGASLYPREIVEAELQPGTYFLRVKMRSQNFEPARDELRLTVSGDFVNLQNRTPGETVLAPADNPRVIAVGATDSDLSSVSRRLNKPDVSSMSLIQTTDGVQYKGSSNSAAAIAARAAVERALDQSLSRDRLLTKLARSTAANRSTAQYPFGPTGPGGCYRLDTLRSTARHLQRMVLEGGTVVQTTDGQKMFIDEDPFARAARLGLRIQPAATARRPCTTSAGRLFGDIHGLFEFCLGPSPGDAIEFVQRPTGAVICPL